MSPPETIFRQARQSRVYQDVVYQIQEAILDGRLSAGERLPSERDLVEMFKTSRGTLREALRVLEQKGLIEIRLGVSGGAIVKGVNTDQISESLALLLRSRQVSLDHLAEFREGVEGHVAALAAERATEADLEILREFLEEARKYCGHPTTCRDDFIRVDKQFHMALARSTSNSVYSFILQTVHDNIHRYYDQYLAMHESELQENYEDLRSMLAAIEARNPDSARSLAEEHVRHFNKYMKKREAQLDNHTSGAGSTRTETL
jgi:GntR family transcriptional regulator, transcriptional repressor for pyruvate dehydrogenase complex